MTIYQVTAMYGDDEIGYAESETYADALADCAESCECEYAPAHAIALVCRDPRTGVRLITRLDHVRQLISMRASQ